jgi:hypothetical protein
MALVFITFIFKINNNTFYGKYYTDHISDDHMGLDEEIRPYLLKGLTSYQQQEKLPEFNETVQIGIISVASYPSISLYSSNEEKKCFDFYCEKFNINYKTYVKIHMFGILIET